MEQANQQRMKHRFVEAPRLDKRGKPLRIKVLEAKPTMPVETFADIPTDTCEPRIIRAICPRGMGTDDIRRALFAEFNINIDTVFPVDAVNESRQHFIGRTGHRSVRFALPE